METEKTGWWHRNGWTVAILLSAFAFAFTIRTVWSYPVIERWGSLYVYAGGSDSYYHSRVMQYIILTGHNLIHDPMLKYPIGGTNPREPLFDWMNAILGLLFAPFFGGSAVVAGSWFLDLQAPLWAALEVFPLYLIGKEVSSRRTGLIAALILPFLSANITSSTFGYANYLSFYTFMILVVVYSYIRTVKALGTHRYVQSYGQPRQFLPALREFYRRDHTGVKWAVFTGVSLGALALSWQGYTYAIVVVGFGLVVAMVAERIRGLDSFSLYVATWIIALVAIPMMTPYYFVQGTLRTFFDLPVLLVFGVLLLTLPFLLMRDIPWVFSIPGLVAIVGAAALGLKLLFPTFFTDIITGQGYFVKTLIYSTVAEAQAPSFDALVIGYGVATFFLAFVGLAIFAYLLVRHKFQRHHIALLVYSVVSLYLPITATKFFLVGSPAYALLSAEALHRALDVGSYPELRRSVASLSDRGSQFAAFRRSFKARHVLVMAVVILIVVPNVWVSIDAGVPGNTKNAVAAQINDSIPSFLKLNASEPAANYLGATGTELDTPNQYDYAAYTWLSEQDTNVPEPDRPAFISWWDYGFQAIDQGEHPSVADNFQNGIDPSGQFLLSQNESLAIGVLATTLLIAEESKTHSKTLPAALDRTLASEGVNITTLQRLLADQSADYTTVVAHPDVYLPVNPSTITDDNAMYLAVSHYLASTFSLTDVSTIYDSVQAYTGWTIRYAAVDSRLFPFSGTDTGIFYAPAELTGRVINDEGLPTTFYNVTVLGSNNETYALGEVPAGVAAERYTINYFAPFYNSMLYKVYIGYNGTQVGQDGGIPGLSGAAASDPLEPGFMLQHFEIVYRTAYYCPGVKNATNSSACMLPANLPTAKALAKSTKGTLNDGAISYFEGGETMLAYYAGEPLDGTVTLPDGAPDAGVRVTVYDSWGIPHMTAVTSATGAFSIILPPGNDTLNLTTGKEDLATQAGSTVLRSIKIDVPDAVGFSLNPETTTAQFTIAPGTLQGTVYWNLGNTSSYSPSVDSVVSGAHVIFTSEGKVANVSATTDASGTYLLGSVPPGNYSFAVKLDGRLYNETNVLVKPGEVVNASAGLKPSSISGTVTGAGGAAYPDATVRLSRGNETIATVTSGSNGDYTFPSLAPGNYSVTASVSGSTLRSVTTPAVVGSEGQVVTVPLTVIAMTPVTVQVYSGSNPVPGVSVRFAPTLSFAAAGGAGVSGFDRVTDNGTIATTGASGAATVGLAAGNYSVYALGYADGALSAAIGTLTVSGSGVPPTLTLSLAPALTLSGVVKTTGNETGELSAVAAFPSSGGEVIAEAATNGSFALRVPAGSYDVLAVHGQLVGTNGREPTTAAALARVNLTGTTSIVLSPSTAAVGRFAVYANLTSDTTVPVASASVTISEGLHGPALEQTAGYNGSVVFFLPSTIPLSAGGYCVSASAPGYGSATRCGLSATDIGGLTVFRLPIATVPTTLTVFGLPTGTSVTVNLTAESATAVDRSVSGGPRFSLALSPGTYRITAYATAGGKEIVYAPGAPVTATIGFAERAASVNLTVLAEILAHGTLSLPSGTTAKNTTVELSSAAQNVTVNGTDYLAGFRISVGSFTASVTATGKSGSTENLTGVTVASGGTISPRLFLNRPGVALSGRIQTVAGKSLTFDGNATLRNPDGARIHAKISDGKFTATLPADHNFTAYVNITISVTGTNGSYRERWTAEPGTVCGVQTTAASCAVSLVSAAVPASLNGTIERTSTSGPVPSQLRIVGPYPATNLSVVDVTNGTFSLSLAPGAYYLYATPSDGAPYAAFANALALPGQSALVLTLRPTTTDTISLASSGTPGQTIGAVTVTVIGVGGVRAQFPGLAVGGTLPVALPSGTYTVRAVAPGSLNGAVANATARATVTISASGNLATRLVLGVPAQTTVVGTLAGPRESNVTAGASATFSFSVRDTGNVPVTVHPVGSPAFWTFAFTIHNVTLAPGGSAVASEVRITVPAGTAVDHAPVAIAFEDANGTSLGNVTPAPVVHVAPYAGLALGHTASHPTSTGAEKAEVPFYVHNTGNVPETVELTVTNAAYLAGIGWSYAFGASGGTDAADTVNVSASTNETLSLNLTFTGTVFVAPGPVTIAGTVENIAHPPSASVTVRVAISKVSVSSLNGHALTITGPGIGSSSTYLGQWELVAIALIPAALLLALIVVNRWWSTRRWSRW